MSNIGSSLKRKIGPLPIWAWAAIVFAAVYYYRNRLSGAAAPASSTATDTGAPQASQVLQPGESVYDPNTGSLLSAPGGDPGATPQSPLTFTGPNGQEYVYDPNTHQTYGPPGSGATISGQPPPQRQGRARAHKRALKRKPGHGQTRRLTRSQRADQRNVSRAQRMSRSAAAIRNRLGGRTNRNSNATPGGRSRQMNAQRPSQAPTRSGRRSPLVHTHVNQHPASSHQPNRPAVETHPRSGARPTGQRPRNRPRRVH